MQMAVAIPRKKCNKTRPLLGTRCMHACAVGTDLLGLRGRGDGDGTGEGEGDGDGSGEGEGQTSAAETAGQAP